MTTASTDWSGRSVAAESPQDRYTASDASASAGHASSTGTPIGRLFPNNLRPDFFPPALPVGGSRTISNGAALYSTARSSRDRKARSTVAAGRVCTLSRPRVGIEGLAAGSAGRAGIAVVGGVDLTAMGAADLHAGIFLDVGMLSKDP